MIGHNVIHDWEVLVDRCSLKTLINYAGLLGMELGMHPGPGIPIKAHHEAKHASVYTVYL